jgi:hypothetical protein
MPTLSISATKGKTKKSETPTAQIISGNPNIGCAFRWIVNTDSV